MNVNSSNLKTVDYDKREKLLTATFINRPRWIYTYYQVPATIWTAFIKAKSKGKFFADFIKDVYTYRVQK